MKFAKPFYVSSNVLNSTLTNYLLKTGDSSGNIGIGTATPNRNFEVFGTNPALVIRAADENQTSTLFLGTGYNNTGAYKCAIIAEGNIGWSKSKLMFCFNNVDNNTYPTYNATVADAKMTILPSGYVGIGSSNPQAKLHILEASGTAAAPNYGSIIIDHDNSGGASSITFRSKVNQGSDYGYIQYQDAATVGGGGESAKLIIGTQNDADDDILLMPSGGVGINTSSSGGYKLYINGNTTITGQTRLTQIFNYGETLTYTADFTGSSGWFWTTNHYWNGYATASYLTIAVTCSGISNVYWYGRAFLSGTGGLYNVICDYRTPDNGNANQITVANWWSSNGWNALRITIQNAVYGGNFNIKVSG